MTPSYSIPKDAQDVLTTLLDAGYAAFLVGGCVRDTLLGYTPKDWDVTTAATPEQVQALFPKTIPVGAKFGVVVVIQGETQIEVATFRQDGDYSDGRRPDTVSYSTDVSDDVLRRDFTINGLILNELGDVVDLTQGQDDLKAQIICTIGNPGDRFREDALRMLRAIRFAAKLDFNIEDGTFSAIQSMTSSLKNVSRERIREEFLQILVAKHAAKGISLLFTSGIAEVIFPPAIMNIDLAWTLKRFREFPTQDRMLALAMFLADLSTGATSTAEMLLSHELESNEVSSFSLKLPRADVRRVMMSVDNSRWISQANQTRRWNKVFTMRLPGAHLALEVAKQNILLGKCTDGSLAEVESFAALTYEEVWPTPLLTGDDLIAMGMKPGPNFSKLLTRLDIAQVEGVVSTREEALEVVQRDQEKGF